MRIRKPGMARKVRAPVSDTELRQSIDAAFSLLQRRARKLIRPIPFAHVLHHHRIAGEHRISGREVHRRNRLIAELAGAQGNFPLASDRFDRSRWALNMKTGERYLFRPDEEDAELRRLTQECANYL